jgi:hypothetical protein
MSSSIYLCVGDIRAIVNRLAAGGTDSKVALLMDTIITVHSCRVRSYYRASLLVVYIICKMICMRVASLTSYVCVDMVN